jgi:hypothetical protein
MKNTIFFLITFLSIIATGCENIESFLKQAKPYKVVGDAPITMNDGKRSGRTFFITSTANTSDEYAQTAIKAAYDLQKKNKKTDIIEVELVPEEHLISRGVSYAIAYFARDKKGMADFSGSDPNEIIKFTWLVRAADGPLTEKELTMVNLWYGHMKDFPVKEVYSSMSYEKADLQKFIADEMHIPVKEAELPVINLKEYKNFPFIN